LVTGLLVDVDDTLIDTRSAMVAAGAAAVAELWPQVDAEVSQAAGVHFHGDPGGFFARYTSGELSFVQMRQARVADLLQSFSFPALDVGGADGAGAGGVAARFEQAYEPSFSANLHAFDDVLPLVEAARSAGVRIGLLTNSSSHYTKLKLEVTGLAGVFAVVATRDTLGFGKPDPRAFHHACELLGSTPAQTVYVGDDLEIDAIGATRAGLRAIWLQRGPGDLPGDVPGGARARTEARAQGIPVVSSLGQVAALLTRGGLEAS
jgi:putative hydrolase of the HAD superfamily